LPRSSKPAVAFDHSQRSFAFCHQPFFHHRQGDVESRVTFSSPSHGCIATLAGTVNFPGQPATCAAFVFRQMTSRIAP
jgi:hypothetical protein